LYIVCIPVITQLPFEVISVIAQIIFLDIENPNTYWMIFYEPYNTKSNTWKMLLLGTWVSAQQSLYLQALKVANNYTIFDEWSMQDFN
jgi:hypothetical protein